MLILLNKQIISYYQKKVLSIGLNVSYVDYCVLKKLYFEFFVSLSNNHDTLFPLQLFWRKLSHCSPYLRPKLEEK